MAKSSWISDLHWARRGQQSRSQRTQEALLDAAAELFSDKGVDATSVADIAAKAGSSVGSVYHHFRDKKALLHALLQRWCEEFVVTTRDATSARRWEGAGIADILEAYLEFAIDTFRTRPGFERIAIEASISDPALRERLVEVRETLDRGLTELLTARVGEIGHPDPPVAIAFVLDQLTQALSARQGALVVREPRLLVSDERFVVETLRSACTYLELEPRPQEAR